MTVVDTSMVEPNDWFNGGTIWMTSGDNDGKSRVISDWNSTTYTFTFPTMTLTCDAGDTYAAADNLYSREAMLQAINEALQELGPFLATDATLTTTANTESYDLPAGVRDVLRVEIATSTTSPYQYYTHRWWREYNDDLYLDQNYLPIASRKIRVWYAAAHAEVSADTDTISNDIHPDLLRWTAAVHALHNRLGYTQGSEPQFEKLLVYAQTQATAMRMRHQIRSMQKDSRLYGMKGLT